MDQKLNSVLQKNCKCNLAQNRVIRNGVFICYKDSPEFITYRGQIYGTAAHSVSEMIEFIEQWLKTSPSLQIQAQLLHVESSCPVEVQSVNEKECLTSGVPTSTIASSSPLSIMTVAAITGGAMCIVIMTCSIVAVITCFVVRRKKSHHNKNSQCHLKDAHPEEKMDEVRRL